MVQSPGASRPGRRQARCVRMSSLAAVALALAAACLPSSQAYPSFWVQNFLDTLKVATFKTIPGDQVRASCA